MTAFDETGVVGHLIMRFTDEEKRILRFGFVIVDVNRRGEGYGREMLSLALQYAALFLRAEKVTLGVFENNPNANHLYKSMGFRAFAQRKVEMPIGTWNCIDMELFLKDEL